MRARALWMAVVLAGFGLPGWCDCPKDPVPPGVKQLQDELGTRAVNVVVRQVHLANVTQATIDEQQQIAASVVGLCFPADKIEAEVAAQIRDAFQRHGFFKVHLASVDIRPLTIKPPTVSVSAPVEEGPRYRLKEVKFTGSKVLTIEGLAGLRTLIPMKNSDVFDVEMVRQGITKLRDAYGQLGYIDFTPVPNAEIDDKNELITLTFDLDEGPVYFIRSVTITGADQQREAALRAAWPDSMKPGAVYNSRLVELFFQKSKDLFPPGASAGRNVEVKRNRDAHTVDIIVRLEPD